MINLNMFLIGWGIGGLIVFLILISFYFIKPIIDKKIELIRSIKFEKKYTEERKKYYRQRGEEIKILKLKR
jgi:hypothetical protein